MKKIKLIFTFAALSIVSCTSKKQVEEHSALTPADVLITRLNALRQHGYMYAHQDDPFYGVSWEWDRNGRSDTRELVGDYPAIFGFDLGGIELGDMKNLDSVPFEWIREEAIRHFERGGIVTFSWHPRNPHNGGTAWVGNAQMPTDDESMTVASILPGGDQHEKFVGWMNNVTGFLATLKTSTGKPVPFILRPWHEYNGSWFWWGEKETTPEQFKGLWNMFQDHVNAELPTNVVWAFSPNLDGLWTKERFLQKYPGDDRVDLIGEDAYQWGTEEQFVIGIKADLTFLNDFAKKADKPIAITECGYKNSPDPTWWTRVLKPIMDKYPISYFLTWRNCKTEHFGCSKDLGTAEDFMQLYKAKNTLFLKDIQ